MPVEIRELVIRVVATQEQQGSPSTQQAPAEDKEAIVQECVRQVMRILKKKQER